VRIDDRLQPIHRFVDGISNLPSNAVKFSPLKSLRAQTPEKFVVPADNHLLARLPRKDHARLLKLSASVPLILNEVLSKPGESLRYVYFPTEGFVSLVTLMDGRPVLEVGMVGREGMLGAQLALGEAPTEGLHQVVQGPGSALRMSSATFKRELRRSAALRQCVHSYIQVTMTQLATSAACLRFHQTGPRLARWLLMTQDRAHSDTFRVTHEFLAFMLGMRRVGITAAATSLQRDGLIKYRRGVLTVVDRGGLLAAACSCYLADRKTYTKLLP
jgi:CRP-like cAMP-binding protein